LKEDLRQLWSQPDKITAEKVIADWIARAEASEIRPLQVMARTLATHRFGILAYYDHPISSGPIEETNNKRFRQKWRFLYAERRKWLGAGFVKAFAESGDTTGVFHVNANIFAADGVEYVLASFMRNLVGEQNHKVNSPERLGYFSFFTGEMFKLYATFLGFGHIFPFQPVHSAYYCCAHALSPCCVVLKLKIVINQYRGEMGLSSKARKIND